MSFHRNRRPSGRVLHIAQAIAGGVASYLEEIAEHQASQFGARNVAFVVPATAAYLPRLPADQLICFRSASRSASLLIEFARTVQDAIASFDPDVVHLHSTFAGAIVRPMLALRKRRPRVIYCPHGWSFGMEVSPVTRRTYAAVERRLAVVTDLLHVNSQAECDLALRFRLPERKLRVIPNGIAWTEPRARAHREGPLRVVFIGRHDRQKGLDILLGVLRRFRFEHIHFEIVGDGVLSSGVDATGDVPNATFHGWLPRQETLRVLERADAVVMPSRWDAAPIVAAEAMRAGVPVIGSDRGAIPEIVGHRQGGYIFPLDNPESLGCLLASLNRSELQRLGLSARQRWEHYYGSDRMNALLDDAYAEALDSGRMDRDRDRAAANALQSLAGGAPW